MKLLGRSLKHLAKADVALALVGATGVSLLLYVFTVHRMGQLSFTYLPANLLLAWIPVLLALWLRKSLRSHLWSDWSPLAITALWLMFLPNSFYVITDLIHLSEVYRGDLTATSVMFFAFAITGLLLGYTSVYIVHQRLRQRLSPGAAFGYITGIFLICSVAIYIGRDLRWNSWDVLVSPTGLLFDLSDRLIHPGEYHVIFAVAGGFFVLLLGLYAALLRAIRAAAKSPLL